MTQQPPQPKRRTPSILGPHTTLVLCAAVFWQAFILALAIAVATSAGGSWHYWSAHVGAYVGGLERA